MYVLITGGAGFIGSHLADALLQQGHSVRIIDNLSHGHREFIPAPTLFVQKDLVKEDIGSDLKCIETIFHFAADPDVRESAANAQSGFDNNLVATFRLLEACRKKDITHVVFASTSAVYGETGKIPTPESAACKPISNYGASKLACEAYLAGYATCYGIRVSILRFANIFGERSTHGVMHDFFHKLKGDPHQLDILGNGKQNKSYLYVADAVAATLQVWKTQKKLLEIFNVGSEKTLTVNEIARGMCTQMDVQPRLVYSGGDRGWVGDVPRMLLDTKKLRALGWKEEISFEEGVRRYADWMDTFYRKV